MIIVKKIGSESFELDVRIPRIISIKLDQGTLKKLDDMWKKAGYKSRSDFIRNAIKIYIELLDEISKQETGERDDKIRAKDLREDLLRIVSQKNKIG